MDINSISERFYCGHIKRTTTPEGCKRRRAISACLCHKSFVKEAKKITKMSAARRLKEQRRIALLCVDLYYAQNKSIDEILDIVGIEISRRQLHNIISRERIRGECKYPPRKPGPAVDLRPLHEVVLLLGEKKSIKEISIIFGKPKNYIYHLQRKAIRQGLLQKKGQENGKA